MHVLVQPIPPPTFLRSRTESPSFIAVCLVILLLPLLPFLLPCHKMNILALPALFPACTRVSKDHLPPVSRLKREMDDPPPVAQQSQREDCRERDSLLGTMFHNITGACLSYVSGVGRLVKGLGFRFGQGCVDLPYVAKQIASSSRI